MTRSQYFLRVLTLFVVTLLTGCEMANDPLRWHAINYKQFDVDGVQKIFQEQSSLRFIADGASPELSVIEALTSDQADLGLVENSTLFAEGIRAVLPMFESVLHILIRDDFDPSRLEQPLRGAAFYVPNQSTAGRRFVQLVTRRQGLTESDYTVSAEFQPGITNIIIYFGPIDPDNTTWAKPGFTLVSLDNHLNPQRKFYREGIGYTAPNMKPKTIPALTYELPGNSEELLTVAVDTLMVVRKEVSEARVYELTRTFLEQKPRFTAIAPHLFSGINESFDPLNLNFPLHSGARVYLERDDPGLLERYAETINMLMYLTFLLITGFVALTRWRGRMKKDRIDVFYERVMAIRARMNTENPEELLAELEALEQEAFDSLIREKLAANESFRIFTDLMNRLRNELRQG